MDDIELLGQLHHLLNHCVASEELLRSQRQSGKVQPDTQAYARWCIDRHMSLHTAAKALAAPALRNAIESALSEVRAYVIGFELGVPYEPRRA